MRKDSGSPHHHRPRPIAGSGHSTPGPATSRGEFDSLLDAVDRGEYTFLDPYAAEDEAEFFAVATEDFFERPAELKAAHPRLYALLQEFYALDPAAW